MLADRNQDPGEEKLAPFRIACSVSIGFETIRKRLASVHDVELIDISQGLENTEDQTLCQGLIVYASHYSASVADWARDQPLKWMHVATAGSDPLDRYPIPEGIYLSSSGHLWSGTVAEHALGMLLALSRGLDFSVRMVETDAWSRKKVIPRLRTVKDLNALIIGYGRIGSEIGRRLKDLGASVTGVACSRRIVDGVKVHEIADLDSLIPAADVIFLSVPLRPSTHHLISRPQFARMNQDLILINISRGGVLDEMMLLETLKEGRISCAGLDVFENEPLPKHHPFRSLSNVLLTPHVAGFGERGIEEKVAENIKDNLLDILSGKAPRDGFQVG